MIMTGLTQRLPTVTPTFKSSSRLRLSLPSSMCPPTESIDRDFRN